MSNSWGSGWGPRTGTGDWADLVAQYFGDSHPNHVILFAASNDAGHKNGNEGGGYFVKKSSASSTSPLGTIIRTDGEGGNGYYGLVACAWNNSNSTKLNCKIHVLNSSTGAVLQSWTVTTNGTSTFSGLSDYYSGLMTVYIEQESSRYRLALYTEEGLESTSSGAYTLAIEVYPTSSSANINMWSGDWSFFTNHLTTSGHTWTAGTDDMCVSDEATIPDAISVGAYVSKNSWKASNGNTYTSNVYTVGDIAYFSSYATAEQSPTGLAYPWISAPGARLAAGVNHYHTASVDSYSYYHTDNKRDLVVNSSTSPYAMMEGTSMATPVAAGIVALWLQAANSVGKTLTVNEVKDIMEQTAITDSYTSGTNASHFGKGKIDALAGIQYILNTGTSPLIRVNPASIDFADRNPYATRTYTKTLNVKGMNLEDGITATLTDASGAYSLSQTSITQSAATASGGVDITITYAPQSAGTHTASITLSSTGATDVVVPLTATAQAATPTIVADPETLSFKAGLNTAKSLTFDVLTEFLTGNVAVTLSDANGVFTVDKTSITKAESEEGATVTVTFQSATAGTFNGTVTLSSPGAESVVISLTGKATDSASNPNTTKFKLVTSIADLEEGMRYIIGCGSKSTAAGALSSSYLNKVDITLSNDVITASSGVAVFILEGNQTDGWTFKNENTSQYLQCTAAKSVSYTTTTPYSWTLSNGTDGVIMTAGSNGTMLYNSSSPRFTTYTSNPTASMIQANLYMEYDDGTTATPSITTNKDALAFSTTVGTPQTLTVEVQSENLTQDITATLTDAAGVFSLGATTISRTASASGTTLNVTFTPTAAGTFSGTLTLSSTGADPVTVSLSATATTPSTLNPVIVADESKTFSTTVGTPQTLTIEILSEDLTEDITATLTDAAGVFSLGTTTISRTDAAEGTTLSVTFTPTAAGTYTGTVTLTSAGADPVTVSLSATATASGSTTSSNDFTLITSASEFEEGDYIIVYDGAAMNTTVSSNRLQYTDVTPVNNVITTSNDAIIWHIAPGGSYYTIYNEGAGKYAASNGTKNQAQLLASGTDDKSLWSVSTGATFDFTNKYNAAKSVNATLRRNGTYGFACYATGTGGPLSLYKRNAPEDTPADPVKPRAPRFSLAGGSYTTPQSIQVVADEGCTIKYVMSTDSTATPAKDYTQALELTTEGKYYLRAIAVKDDVESNVAQANYTYTAPAASGSSDVYELVTSTDQLVTGKKYVIAATNSGTTYALSTTQSSNNRSATQVTKSGNTITATSDTQVLTLDGDATDGWSFYTGSGYLYAASSSKNYLKTQTTNDDNGLATISVTNAGVASITFQGSNTRNQLKFNPNNGNPIFSCYASDQTSVSLYVQQETSAEPEASDIDDGIYRIKDAVGYLCVNPDGTLSKTTDPSNLGTIFTAVKQTDGTYRIQAQDRTIATANGSTVTLSEDATISLYHGTNNEYISLGNDKYVNADVLAGNVGAEWTFAAVETTDTNLPTIDLSTPTTGSATSDCTYRTFYADFPLTLSEGRAYTITLNGHVATANRIDGTIPAGTPVLIVTGEDNDDSATSISIIPQLSAIDLAGFSDEENVLRGTCLPIATSSIDGNVYVFSQRDGVPGFYRYNGTTLGANKAYLVLGAAAANPSSFSIHFPDDETTGVEVIPTADGATNTYYDLSGRRVTSPTTGVYVLNGKKVLVK